MNGETLMRSIVAAFANSDLRPLLSHLDDNVVWKSASRYEDGPFSFKGDYKNKAGVVEVLSKISRDYTFLRMEPKEIMAKGDVAWGLFDVSLRYDPKGKSGAPSVIRLDFAIRWLLKDGMIVEHQAFFDTAHLLLQQGLPN